MNSVLLHSEPCTILDVKAKGVGDLSMALSYHEPLQQPSVIINPRIASATHSLT